MYSISRRKNSSIFRNSPSVFGAFSCLLLILSATSAVSSAARADAKTDVVAQLTNLRLNQSFDVESAKKVNDRLYEADLRGTGPKRSNDHALLYRPENGGWLLLTKAESRQFGFLDLDHPIFVYSLNRAAIETNDHAPREVRDFLAAYFTRGDTIRVNRGVNIAAVWYPKQVGGEVGDLIQRMGLKDSKFLASNKASRSGGLVVKGRYDYLAQGGSIMSVSTQLAKPPGIASLPGGIRIRDKSVKLQLQCKIDASLDFFRSRRFDELSCQAKFDTLVRVKVNGSTLYFDTAVGVRRTSYGNSKAFSNEKALKKALGVNPNVDYALFLEGTLHGGAWNNIFGKKGFDLQQVELQALADRATGFHIGIFGEMDFGDQTRMTASLLLPANVTTAAYGNIALEGSLSHITLDQLVMLPAAIGGPKTYPKAWRKRIRDAGLDHFYVDNLKVTFSPEMTDPDLGINQAGVTATGGLVLFNRALGSAQFRITDSGVYSDTAVNPFSVGWFTLKNSRLKMYIPAKKDANITRAKKLLKFAGQNIFVFFFDTEMRIGGQPQRALVSFTALNAGVAFDANIAKGLGLGFELRLPLARIADGKAPFAVSGYFHDKKKFGDLVRKMVSESMNAAARKIDTSFDSETKDIEQKTQELKKAKVAYETTRRAAEKQVAKIKAPLTKAENYLNSVNGHLDYLRSEGDNYKNDFNHTAWYKVGDRAHDLYEEGKYYGEWAGYKGTVEAAQRVVDALRKSIHYIPVDADPTVVADFAAYNGAKYALAVAKGALIAAKKSNDFLAKLPGEIVDRTADGFSIGKAAISGTASGEDAFDLHLNMAGKALGVAWNISPKVAIAAPGHAGAVADANFKALASELSLVGGSLATSAHNYYRAEDYASFPPKTVLAYSWDHIPGWASDIAAGKGRVYVTNGNGRVFEWLPKRKNWRRLPRLRNMSRVAVAPDGSPLLVSRRDHRLWFWDKAKKDWAATAASIQDVGAGADGTIWITLQGNQIDRNGSLPSWISEIDRKKLGPDGEIWRKKPGGRWEHIPGAARRVAVDAHGDAWVTNSAGNIYHWTGSSWHQLPGWASDIGVDDGKVWVIGGNDTIWTLIKGSEKWVRVTGGGANLSVDKDGLPWVVSDNGEIWRNNGPE